MNIFQRLAGGLRRIAASAILSTSTLRSPAQWLVDAFAGSGKSASGETVNRKTALKLAPYFQAVNLVSGDVAKMDLHVLHEVGDSKEHAKKHPAYYLLRFKPNAEQTAMAFKRTIVAHAMTQGNGYAWIERDRQMRPVGLWLLDPELTYPVRENRELQYVTQVDGTLYTLSPADVLHVHGLGYDGLTGYSVAEYATESIGLGLATQKYGGAFFGNGTVVSGILEFPGIVKPELAKQIRDEWNTMHRGGGNAFKIGILSQNGKFNAISGDNQKAQFLETRQMTVREIAAWFNIPPHKLGDSSKVAYNSIEQENRSYAEAALDVWCVTIEEECWDKLLTEKEKRSGEYRVKFNMKNRLRTDAKTETDILNSRLDRGVINVDEYRGAIDMNPLPDGQGKEYRKPTSAYQKDSGKEKPADESGQDDKAAAGDTAEEDDAKTQAALRAHRALLLDAAERMVRIEVDRLRSMSRKPDFADLWTGFLGEHQERVRSTIDPIIDAMNAAGMIEDAEATAEWAVGDHIRRLNTLATACAAMAVTDRLAATEQWAESEPAAMVADVIQTQTSFSLA